MYKLFDELLEGKEFDVTESELERVIGAGQGIISHQRRTGNDLSFVNVLRSVMYICPGSEQMAMKKFIESFTSENNIRVSVEYALSNRDFDLCDQIMERLNEIGKVKNVDWVKTYEIVKAFQKRELSLKELDSLVSNHKPKNIETRTLTNILKCYVDFYKQNWVDIQEAIPQIREEINAIKNDYIQTTFTIRLNELVSHVELHVNNNVEGARELVKQTNEAEFSFKFNLHTHYILGKSYMLEDYETSLKHLEKYVDELKKCGDHGTADNVIKMDIAFLKNHWNKENLEITSFSSIGFENELSPYETYYKGKILNNLDMIMESMLKFIKKGDFYLAQIPKKIIEHLPFVEQVYESLRRKYDEIEI
ncbi:AimR family lysis-lysogeny pheromone receptor [Rossellomorea marisflavi]|uniref:AimR family lysis-lysogeny pheromone receptor n=1 Tax=Rossellomorea marisflavi TaxID=189381 RepID=UPI00345C8A49